MDEVEMPLVPVVADMEEAGYAVDKDFFLGLRQRLQDQLGQVEAQIQAIAAPALGRTDFNPGSTDQVAALLFEKLNLPVVKQTPTGKPSTDEQVLQRLQGQHAVIPLLLRRRQLAKLTGTYCTIPDAAGEDGRLRVEFKQLGAETGRFTSDSVIQTLPKSDEWELRKGFVAPPGAKIVAADFVQQELYLLAGVSRDQKMLKAIRERVDLHGLAAVRVFGLDCSPAEVKARYPSERDRVKSIQFGLVYGQSPQGLADAIGTDLATANRLLEEYFKQFPTVKRFIEDVHARVVRDGYVDDLFGRRRYLLNARLSRPRKRYERMTREEKALVGKINAAKRAAQNFVIQGAGATITKLAMLRCHRHIRAEHQGIRMILTLHDELQFEVPEGEVSHFAAELPALMCDLGLDRFGFDVPMAVEVKAGPTWGDLKPYEPREGRTDGATPTTHCG
jgi:DNA polymerase-1